MAKKPPEKTHEYKSMSFTQTKNDCQEAALKPPPGAESGPAIKLWYLMNASTLAVAGLELPRQEAPNRSKQRGGDGNSMFQI